MSEEKRQARLELTEQIMEMLMESNLPQNDKVDVLTALLSDAIIRMNPVHHKMMRDFAVKAIDGTIKRFNEQAKV